MRNRIGVSNLKGTDMNGQTELNVVLASGLDSSRRMGSCEHGNEFLGSTKGGNFLTSRVIFQEL
jgi:hypothetical protein